MVPNCIHCNGIHIDLSSYFKELPLEVNYATTIGFSGTHQSINELVLSVIFVLVKDMVRYICRM